MDVVDLVGGCSKAAYHAMKGLGRFMKRLSAQVVDLVPLVFTRPVPDEEFLVITGADSSHYRSLRQFLLSLFAHEAECRVVVVDLGLKRSERLALESDFLKKIQLKVFDYSKYPPYFNIKINAGEYAWKPVIVADALDEFKCCVCWMDAGNLIREPLVVIRRAMASVGFYSPRSAGTIRDWTHPGTLGFLKVDEGLLTEHNLSGACVAVNYRNKEAVSVARRWKECALMRSCIAPEGSNRLNHRQDQAVLSVIAHQAGITRRGPRMVWGFAQHQDID